MSDYQRITSYLYEYRNGNRGENVGFIRVETRDQQLKISFTLNASAALAKLQLYFYYYSHGKMIGIPWDEITKIEPHYEYKESFYIHSIFNHTPLLTDMDGILLYDNNSHFYGSQWNETPIDLHVFETPKKTILDPKISKTPSLEEYMEALSLHESIVEVPSKPKENPTSEEKDKAVTPPDLAVKDTKTTAAFEKHLQTHPKKQLNSTTKEDADELTTQELEKQSAMEFSATALEEKTVPEKVSIEPNKKTSAQSEKMLTSFKVPDSTPEKKAAKDSFVSENRTISPLIAQEKKSESEGQKEEKSNYPQIYPYPTPDYSSCIKLTLEQMKDFACIPKELAGNGFLKMQVQNYGHLFLGEQKLTDCHYIGIPGIFTNQRNFVAHLFGFPDFITVPHEEQKTGNFGYWVMTIDH